jgi:hypothetical protein
MSTFYRSGKELSVAGYGQQEGQQSLSVLKRKGMRRCFKDGCERYEKGWDVTLNLADPQDANAARFIREGKLGRFEERVMGGLEGVLTFHFSPGECLGHQMDWQDDPVYIAGTRKTVREEWHTRLDGGARTLIAATTRKNEMAGKE